MRRRIELERTLKQQDPNYKSQLPAELKRTYQLAFHMPDKAPYNKSTVIRDVKANHIGKLLLVRGIVVRATEV